MNYKRQSIKNQQKIGSLIQMSQTTQQFKNPIQNDQNNDELKKSRKNGADQSLTAKNWIKKMTSKKGQLQQKAQPKITAYMNVSNSTSFGNESLQNNLSNITVNSQQQRIRQLEQRIKQRDLEVQKMKKAREIDENRYSNLFYQNKQNKRKSRQAIAKSMLQAAEYRRNQRRQINPKLGYFKDGLRTFVEGSLLTNLRNKIKTKQQMIKDLQQEKKCKQHQKRQRAIFKAEFLQKQVFQLTKQLCNYQNHVYQYKQVLKLADQQSNCHYALNNWPIAFGQYQTLQLLGKGGFGQVYKCYDLQSNQSIALKLNHLKKQQDLSNQQQFIKHVQRQAEIMKKLHHPNIGKFLQLLECSANKVTFALEYCSGPELSKYLRKHTCLEEKQAKQIVRQIFSALNYLSNLKQKIIHYDLKPSNIMFHNGLIKILDFGLCKPMGTQESRIQLTSQGVGTYWYLPPETFYQNSPQITPKVDVWSAGVIFYEMLYGQKPFGNKISQDKIFQDGIILKATKVSFPPQTPKKFKVSQNAKNFIRQCLSYDPQQRLSASQAYQHQYFKR